MKLSRRSILLLAGLLTAMTLSVAGTVAYLTDTAQITNTFTVGKVQIQLDETVVTPDGKPAVDPATGEVILDPNTGKPQRTEQGNDYHLIPGYSYTKDPVTTVKAGSEASYIRMKVTITNYAKLQAAFAAHGKTFVPGEWVAGSAPQRWLAAGSATDADGNLVLEYRYVETVNTTLAPQADRVLEPLFTAFTAPDFLTGDDMRDLAGMEVQVRAEAMQAAGFDTADAAWAAFDETVRPISDSPAPNGEGVQLDANAQSDEGEQTDAPIPTETVD